MSTARVLLCLSVVAVLVPSAWWWRAGARIGFWQTQVAVAETDLITGLTVQQWRSQFVPGIETPIAGVALAGVALAASLYLQRRNQK